VYFLRVAPQNSNTSIEFTLAEGQLTSDSRLKENHPSGLRRIKKKERISKKMGATTHSIEVNAPLRAVYNQWTQFEEFPRFMEGVEEVRQERVPTRLM
jgi:uncharacterized membrane protein